MMKLDKPVRRKVEIIMDNRRKARDRDTVIVTLYPGGTIGFRASRCRTECEITLSVPTEIRMALTCDKSTHDVPRYDPDYGFHTVYIHYDTLPHFETRQIALTSIWGRYIADAKDIPDGKDFTWAVRVLVQGQFLSEHFTEAELVQIILLMNWTLTPDGERRILEIHTQLSSGIVEDSGECEYSGLWFRNGNLYVDVPAPIHPEPSLPTSECMGAKQQGRAKRTRNQGEV